MNTLSQSGTRTIGTLIHRNTSVELHFEMYTVQNKNNMKLHTTEC